MNKKIQDAKFFDALDELESNKDSVQMGMEAGGVTNERPTKGAAAGCKPGSIRHTYVLPVTLIDKLKAIAGYFGKPEVGIVLDILEKGVTEYEEKYGKKVSSLSRL